MHAAAGPTGRRRFEHLEKGNCRVSDRVPHRGLDAQGIATSAEIFWNLQTAPLVEHAVRRGEGLLAKDGPLVVRTGQHTGRSAQDKFTVRDELTDSAVWWNKGN